MSVRIDRERDFWDHTSGAEGFTEDQLRVKATDRFDGTKPWLPYLGIPDMVDACLAVVGNPSGKRILDLGTGTGFLASLLAVLGARVDAVDISESSLEIARRRAVISGVSERVSLHNQPCERLEFPDGTFDAVLGSFVLHHADIERAGREIHRVLKRNGNAAMIETMGLNPLLMVSRRYLPGRFGITRSSSDDECPLGADALAKLEVVFPGRVQCVFPQCVFFRMGVVVPILRGSLPMAILGAADGTLSRFASLRRFGYFGVVVLRRRDD